MTEERSDMVSSTQREQLFDLSHGIPGARKKQGHWVDVRAVHGRLELGEWNTICTPGRTTYNGG